MSAYLKQYLHQHPFSLVVQIGACDGKQYDPLFESIQEIPTVRGILVEPIPFLFEKLKNNYAGHEFHVEFEQAAISPNGMNGVCNMVYVDPSHYCDNPQKAWEVGISTVVPQRGDIRSIDRASLRAISVPCMKLHALLEKHKATHPDVVVIDTEGADMQICQQLDLDAWKPAVILCEVIHLFVFECDRLVAWLNEHGYETQRVQNDILATRK